MAGRLSRRRRRTVARSMILSAGLAVVTAIVFLIVGPSIQASRNVEVPIGWGTFVFAGAVVTCVIASAITLQLEPEPLRLHQSPVIHPPASPPSPRTSAPLIGTTPPLQPLHDPGRQGGVPGSGRGSAPGIASPAGRMTPMPPLDSTWRASAAPPAARPLGVPGVPLRPRVSTEAGTPGAPTASRASRPSAPPATMAHAVPPMPVRPDLNDVAIASVATDQAPAQTRASSSLLMSTAPSSLPPPKATEAMAGPTPACPQCDAPMAWVDEHLRFYCKQCRMYF
jgi:hypothetical protein